MAQIDDDVLNYTREAQYVRKLYFMKRLVESLVIVCCFLKQVFALGDIFLVNFSFFFVPSLLCIIIKQNLRTKYLIPKVSLLIFVL